MTEYALEDAVRTLRALIGYHAPGNISAGVEALESILSRLSAAEQRAETYSKGAAAVAETLRETAEDCRAAEDREERTALQLMAQGEATRNAEARAEAAERALRAIAEGDLGVLPFEAGYLRLRPRPCCSGWSRGDR